MDHAGVSPPTRSLLQATLDATVPAYAHACAAVLQLEQADVPEHLIDAVREARDQLGEAQAALARALLLSRWRYAGLAAQPPAR